MDARGTSKECNLVLHDDSTSSEVALCGSNLLPLGGIAHLNAFGAKTLCIQARGIAKNSDEVSIHVTVAEQFGFENRMKASLQIIEDVESATASHVEISFRDQHLSRADMWRISTLIHQTTIHRSQKLKYLGSATATVEAIYASGRDELSAFVSNPHTKLIFRSFSARFTFLIQISKEMLENWIGSDLMFERMINGFFPELFRRGDELKVRHHVSIILFGRRDREVEKGTTKAASGDFFHVIAQDIPSNSWPELLRKLKKAFTDVQLPRDVSLAASGNMLEAINLAAIDYADPSVDPQLTSTSTSVVAITAGSGCFDTTKSLLKRTTDLLIGSNTGVDLVSLSPIPLHPAPLFRYKSRGVIEFALPHWLDISYWTPGDKEHPSKWLIAETADDLVSIKIAPVAINETASPTSVANRMADFDEDVFGLPDSTAQPIPATQRYSDSETNSPSTNGSTHVKRITPSLSEDSVEQFPLIADGDSITPRPTSPMNKQPLKKNLRQSTGPLALLQTNRKISLGPKGLALSQGVASTTVSAQHAQHEREMTAMSPFAANEATSGLARQIRESLQRKTSQQSLISRPIPMATKPIDIQSGSERGQKDDPASLIEKAVLNQSAEPAEVEDSSLATTPRADVMDHLSDPESPWLVLLNPCNPRKDNMQVASQYRQWKNIFPRAVSSAVFKWDSICKPASLPLITEVRVSLPDLEKSYNKTIRRLLTTNTPTKSDDSARQAMIQMIAVRLSAGFQVVPRRKDRNKSMPSEHTKRMLLSLGDLYHDLRYLSSSEVQVTEYERLLKAIDSDNNVADGGIARRIRIRSFISSKEQSVFVGLPPPFQPFDWSRFDDQSVNRAALADSAGRFCIRIVLIPVDFSRTEMQRMTGMKDLSDDERRIDGIQALTQVWQRNRIFTEEEQRQLASVAKAKAAGAAERDPNPLAIEYQTRDLSIVTRAMDLSLPSQHDGEMSPDLFSESNLYNKNNFDMAKLVKHMQELPPSGVELRDRRWFTRLHLKCCRGDEMTNWLLRVFKDLQTREGAVALGNQLMDQDILTHVRGRHEFRDGNYFYQIRAAHRTTVYPDSTGFFDRALGRSVPSTPLIESKESPSVRAAQNSTGVSDIGSPVALMSPSRKREKKKVLLSQRLLCNVDSSKKSDQVEIINLHYDRIHSPENCYHIRLDWTSTTPKLIRDSIARWTSLVEPYGLKLVQVPVKEASRFQETHPFDQPVSVNLSVRPPDRNSSTPQFNASSFSPHVTEDPDGYHKALLRKMGFVLDLESARSFPQSLNVTYSWGRPDYDYTQFVHKSGRLLVQIVNNGKVDFLLVPNRVAQLSASLPGRRSETITLEKIVEDFVGFCRDEKALILWFEEAARRKTTIQSPLVDSALATDVDVPPMELPALLTNHRALLRQVG